MGGGGARVPARVHMNAKQTALKTTPPPPGVKDGVGPTPVSLASLTAPPTLISPLPHPIRLQLLPTCFRTSRFSSFQRQLNK